MVPRTDGASAAGRSRLSRRWLLDDQLVRLGRRRHRLHHGVRGHRHLRAKDSFGQLVPALVLAILAIVLAILQGSDLGDFPN